MGIERVRIFEDSEVRVRAVGFFEVQGFGVIGLTNHPNNVKRASSHAIKSDLRTQIYICNM